MKTMDPARKRPTLADLEALPPGIKGEIIEGVLYTMTRPRAAHQDVCASVAEALRAPFHHERGGPGGWWILPEPGIELPNTPEISPDVAGWKRTTMPSLPKDEAIKIVPDWVCEILSPSTRRHDLLIKRPYYAKIGVQHHWVIDLEAKTLSASRNDKGQWVEIGAFGDEREVKIAPFDAVPIDVAAWWV